MAPPGAWFDLAGAVHPYRRGVGPDQLAWRMGPRYGLPPAFRMGRQRAPGTTCRRERLGQAVSQPGFCRPGRTLAARAADQPVSPGARAYRRSADRRPRGSGCGPRAAQGARGADRGGRLRHRLLEPQLPLGAADRLPEDRPVVRGPDDRRRPRRGDRAGDHLARALAAPAGARRGCRDAGAARVPAPARLQRIPGLSVFAPVHRRRGERTSRQARRRIGSTPKGRGREDRGRISFPRQPARKRGRQTAGHAGDL